jgi:hypothetical protein
VLSNRAIQLVLMTEIVPDGYISVREAVNRLGPEGE